MGHRMVSPCAATVTRTTGGPEMSLSERRAQIAEKERQMRLEERSKKLKFKVRVLCHYCNDFIAEISCGELPY